MVQEENSKPPGEKQPQRSKPTFDIKEEQEKAEIRRKINYLVRGRYSSSQSSSRSSTNHRRSRSKSSTRPTSTPSRTEPQSETKSKSSRKRTRATSTQTSTRAASTQTSTSSFERNMKTRSKVRRENSRCVESKIPPKTTKSKQRGRPKSKRSKRTRNTNTASRSKSQRSPKRRKRQNTATKSRKRKAKSTSSSESSRSGSSSRSRSRSPAKCTRDHSRAKTRSDSEYGKSQRKGRSTTRRSTRKISNKSSSSDQSERSEPTSRESSQEAEPPTPTSTTQKSGSMSCKCPNKKSPSRSNKQYNSCKKRPRTKKIKNTHRWSLPVIDRKCLEVKRFVKFHYKFISYQEIVQYLKELERSHRGKVDLKVTGISGDGKEIYLVIISKNLPYPTMSTIIEAGSNGEEFYTVSSALCLIDYLARSPNSLKLMDYYIIPCLNPDAYDYILEGLKNPCARSVDSHDNINLSRAFPKVDSPLDSFKSENGSNYPPEVFALGNTLYAYRSCSRMFLSLRESGRFILYPWGHTSSPAFNSESLINVASAGAKMFGDDMTTHAISEKCRNYKGTAIDYVKYYHPPVSYCFSLHINDCFCTNKGRREERIVELGKKVRRCVKAMIRRLYLTVMENENHKCVTSCNVKKTVQ